MSEAPELIWASPQEPDWFYNDPSDSRDGDFREYIRADLALQWNSDMSQAPRDGTPILTWTKCLDGLHDVFCVMYWGRSNMNGTSGWCAIEGFGYHPTHWTHITPPPKEGKACTRPT